MTQLSNFSLDQLAGAVALGLSSVGGLMLILFKSKCTSVDYSCCWGLFKYPSMGLQGYTSYDVLPTYSQKDHKLPYRCMKIF